MPEGGGAAEQPATAGQQVDAQVAINNVSQLLGGAFGLGLTQHTSGGGGAGGGYEFASLEGLDAIIRQFETELEAIMNDGITIAQAMQLVAAPAKDPMSTGQAEATKRSLEALQQHNASMEQYTIAELNKLRQARDTYARTEEDSADTMGRMG